MRAETASVCLTHFAVHLGHWGVSSPVGVEPEPSVTWKVAREWVQGLFQ